RPAWPVKIARRADPAGLASWAELRMTSGLAMPGTLLAWNSACLESKRRRSYESITGGGMTQKRGPRDAATNAPRPTPTINDLWYKNAVIYCLSVGTFMDANGDG